MTFWQVWAVFGILLYICYLLVKLSEQIQSLRESLWKVVQDEGSQTRSFLYDSIRLNKPKP